MSQHTGEFRTLQAGRGLAALAVVLFHLNGSIFGKYKYWPDQINPIFSAGSSGVEFFFVLSGFVMIVAHWRQLGSRGDPIAFWWKRIARVYLPYWFALAGVLIGFSAGFGDSARGSAISSLKAFFLWPTAELPPLDVSWTLQHEVLFYVFFGIAIWRPLFGFVIMTLWIAPSTFVSFFPTAFFFRFVFSEYHPLFLFGMLGAIYVLSGKIVRPRLHAIIGILGFAILWTFEVYILGSRSTAMIWGYGVSAAVAVSGITELERRRETWTPKILTLLGDASYSIYLVHFPVLSVTAKLFFAFGLAQMLHPVASFIILLLIALIAGFAFRVLIERPAVDFALRRRKFAFS